jgi:putative hydrolase of the HAD superfamily
LAIRAVLFDLGGTLIKTSPPSKVLATILRDSGAPRSPEKIEDARKAVERQSDLTELPTLGETFWLNWNARILEHLGIHEESTRLAERIVKEWWQYAEVELYADVEETLTLLRQRGLKVGIVTNGLDGDLREILRRVGLNGYFDIEVTSNLVGKMKPHRRIFMHALEDLGVEPEEAIHIGDLVDADYKGARSCGLKALLVDRDDLVKDPSVEKIRALTELLQFI